MGAYKPPGAYSKTENEIGATILPNGNFVVALVGPGADYYIVNNEPVTKGVAGGSDSLAHTATELLSVGKTPNKGDYVSGTHFQLTTGAVDWSPAAIGASSGTLTSDNTETFDMSGLTLNLETESGTDNLSGVYFVAAMTAVALAASITANATFVSATASNGRVVISSLQKGDFSYVKVLAGTANDEIGLFLNQVGYGFGEPATGSIYYVTYKYAKASTDYEPKIIYSEEDGYFEVGYPLNNGEISLLGLAVQESFLHNPAKVIICQSTGSSNWEYQEAIDKLENEDVWIVVPLSTTPTIAAYTKQHVEDMSSYLNRKERRAYLGHPDSKIKIEVKDATTGVVSDLEVDSAFLGVGLGALKCNINYDGATCYTRKAIQGIKEFSSYPATADVISLATTLDSKRVGVIIGYQGKETAKNDMGGAGVTITHLIGGIEYRVRHDLTTDMSDVNSSEPSIVSIQDYIAQSSRAVIERKYEAEKQTLDLWASVELTQEDILTRAVEDEILASFVTNDITAAQNPSDPRGVLVTCKNLEAIYPALFFDITFTYTI